MSIKISGYTLDEVREMLDWLPEAPWHYELIKEGMQKGKVDIWADGHNVYPVTAVGLDIAEFIIAARTLLPALVEVVERQDLEIRSRGRAIQGLGWRVEKYELATKLALQECSFSVGAQKAKLALQDADQLNYSAFMEKYGQALKGADDELPKK